MKPVVYIASPYTKGNQAINVNFQIKIFNELLDDGVVLPFAPLFSHFAHIVHPKLYEDYVIYDCQMLRIFDACLRLDVKYDELRYCEFDSPGADKKVEFFKDVLHKPVFYRKNNLYKWVEQSWPKKMRLINKFLKG